MLGEGVGADITEYVDMPVIALLQALQGAVLLGLVEEGVDLVEQAAVFAGRHRPAQAGGLVQIEANAHVGEVHLVHRQLVGVNQGQVDGAFVDHAQQVDHFHRIRLFIAQLRQLQLQGGKLLGMAAALEHNDMFAR